MNQIKIESPITVCLHEEPHLVQAGHQQLQRASQQQHPQLPEAPLLYQFALWALVQPALHPRRSPRSASRPTRRLLQRVPRPPPSSSLRAPRAPCRERSTSRAAPRLQRPARQRRPPPTRAPPSLRELLPTRSTQPAQKGRTTEYSVANIWVLYDFQCLNIIRELTSIKACEVCSGFFRITPIKNKYREIYAPCKTNTIQDENLA